jgi:very-short-patch-repair endonuclease
VTTAELVGAGITKARIRLLVRRKVLIPVARGIYAQAAAVERLDWAGAHQERFLRLAAALVTLGPQATGSHHDAALVHGMALLERVPADIAISRPIGSGGSRTGSIGIRMHTTWLPEGHVVASKAMRITSPARTVVDLARTVSFRSGVVTADSALNAGLTSKAELNSLIKVCARWPGIERARQVVDFSDRRSESPFESIARVAFRDGGLPKPELQVEVGGYEYIGRADFFWPRFRTIAEADGALKYADPDRAREQLRRDARLREAGFEVVHFTWRELIVTPDRVVNAIWSAFRRGAVLRAAERGATRIP